MGFIRAAIWTVLCVGMGIFAGTYEVGGGTPLEHLQREWSASQAPEELDEQLDKLVDGAKTKLAEPVEKISRADRASLNSLIAKKQK